MAFILLSASAGWQDIMVYAIVACCALYAILHTTRFFKKKGNRCGNCPNCASTHATHPHNRSKHQDCFQDCQGKEKKKKNCCG